MSGDLLDAIVIGQGLAGTALAWHLLEARWRIAVLDDAPAVSASKISAGLLTPILGRKFSRNDDASVAYARSFYRRVEALTGVSGLLRDIPAVRLFADEVDKAVWQQRREPLQGYLLDPQPCPIVPPDIVAAPLGGFVMPSGQLDTSAYLAASRASLPVHTARIDTADIAIEPAAVRVGKLAARRLVFCEGFAGAGNPYFPGLRYRSAKGDILLVRLHADVPTQSIHRRFWLAPTSDPAVYRTGATFDWEHLDHVPTAAGRESIEAELATLLACRYDVVGHMAAVRPIIRGGGVIGASPLDARIHIFNGLGTKGASRAPMLARILSRHLIEGDPIPPSLDVATAL